MLNHVPALSAVRLPRGMVKLNGQPITGWVEWEVDNNAHYQADTWRVTFAAAALPIAKNAAWLTAQADLTVELLAGFPADPRAYDASELTSFIIGRADDMTFDPAKNVIELSGRDYTSQFIDAKTTEKFANKTASQIAQILAARHNMTCNTVPTKALAGTYYQIDHATMADERTEWDLLVWLARMCQYSVFVTGTVLNFVPQLDPEKGDKYIIKWQAPTPECASPTANVERIRFSRNLTIAKDVIVIVKSWNAKQKKAFSVTARATKSKNKVTRNSKVPYGQPQTYSYTIPGLTHQAALEKAQNILADISKHEMRMDSTLPGDGILSTQTLVQVVGTETAFDQVYYPESVIRSLSLHEGYKMELRAKNHSPETTVTI
ncbi:MAG: hypothetical protein CVU73_11115 [Deltaproteobacteria bacterium HGW-Deltaproteobacteria-8]|nr:MAG: hypothetical protein CVU73_11115 [Deltaproteobacteria bacterium HGW-Deltaproteobacteria-8]